MTDAAALKLYFNFRSPYCYLASKTMWDLFEAFHVELVWRPLGGWDGRSDPERVKAKLPAVRQDLARWTERLGIPMTPPPATSDPTRAGAASLLAERAGCLRPYLVEAMRLAWAEGRDLGDLEVLREVARRSGLDPAALCAAADAPEHRSALQEHAAEARRDGVFGVPSLVIGEAVFWGNDRLDFLQDHLKRLRLSRA